MRRAENAAIVVVVIVLGAALAAYAYYVGIPLAADIETALTKPSPRVDPGAMSRGTHGTPAGDSLVGAALVVLAAFAGAIPVALVALALAWRTERLKMRWNRKWRGVFLGGFIFQVYSTLLTGCTLLTMMVAFSSEGSILAKSLLVLSVLCSALGVRAWRRLQGAVAYEGPSRIT